MKMQHAIKIDIRFFEQSDLHRVISDIN